MKKLIGQLILIAFFSGMHYLGGLDWHIIEIILLTGIMVQRENN